MFQSIIVDDNEKARISLRNDILNNCPEIEIVAELDGVVSAAKFLKQNKIDVIFLDIQMEDGTGFDLLDILKEINFHIIFITAYDTFALKAFKYAALDYLLKPIDVDDLKKAVKKLGTNKIDSNSIEFLKYARQTKDFSSNLLALNTSDKTHVIKIENIVRCQSDDNYTLIYLADKTKHIVSKSLIEYEKILTDKGFIRVHDKHLINSKSIIEFQKHQETLLMSDNSIIPVSSRRKKVLTDWLKSL